MEKNDVIELLNEIKNIALRETERLIDQAKRNLKIKYDCDFDVIKISNQILDNTSKLYVLPLQSDKPVFVAYVNKETYEITDNFMDRIMADKILLVLQGKFENKGIKSTAYISLSGDNADRTEETDININVKEYFEMYNIKNLFMYLAVSKETLDSHSAEKIVAVLTELSNEYGVSVIVNGIVINDAFDKCSNEITNNPEVRRLWFRDYNPCANFGFSIINSKLNVKISQISEEINNGR